MLFYLLIATIVLLLSPSSAQKPDCEYTHEKRTYICKNIVDAFPNKFYGNYHLKCVRCLIPFFTDRTFVHDNALISFNISGSGVQVVTPHAFSALSNVQYLYLQNNKIANISENAFHGLRQVFELHLEGNQLKTLTKGFLNEMEANQVILSGNLLEELSGNVFKGSRVIINLDLSRNKLRLLNQDAFNYLDGLEYLDLQYNNLCYIPLGVFRNLVVLKELSLAGNKISRVGFGSFSGLINLQQLNLSRNNINEFDDGSLLAFNQITSLDLSRNGLNYLDVVAVHSSAPSLRRINIDDNLWSCSTLKNLMQYLKSIHLDVVNYSKRYSVPNVYGIACTEVYVKEKVSFENFLKAAEEDTKKYVNYC